MINFFDLDYIEKTVIAVINYKYHNENNPAHNYLGESLAMEHLAGCLERVQWDYIQDFMPKAAQLFLCINKGHFFFNGNKRMALVVLTLFLIENGYEFKNNLNKDDYTKYLKKLFPNFNNFENESNFKPDEFGFYNLTIITADQKSSDYPNDELKNKVENFLKFATIAP